MEIADSQVVRVLASAVRLINGSRDGILAEVEAVPLLDRDETDSALDSEFPEPHPHGLRSAHSPSRPGDGQDHPAASAGELRRFVGRVKAKALLGHAASPAPARSASAPLAKIVSARRSVSEKFQPVTGSALKAVRGASYPGHPAWESLPLEERVQWWADRVGTLVAAAAALPALSGRAAKLTKATPLLGVAAQTVTVCAVARECGVSDEVETIRVLAEVIFKRSISEEEIRRAISASPVSIQLTQLDAAETLSLKKLGSAGRSVRQIGVMRSVMQPLRGLDSLLDARPRGGRLMRALSNVPIAGAGAAFFAERAGLHEAAQQSLNLFECANGRSTAIEQ